MKSVNDIRYSDIGHERQVLDIYLPKANRFPVFIYFHGGGLNSGDKSNHIFVNDLVNDGIAVVCANYRLYPFAVFPQFIQDAAADVVWVKNNIGNYGECTGLFVGGSSAGGYITQMLCFDKKYFAIHGLNADDINGYFMDAGQPTSHFNVLKEHGFDYRKVVIDETAPIYFIDGTRNYPPIKIIVSDNDMPNRYEQTMLLVSTMKCCGCDMGKVELEVVKDSAHCEYCEKVDENNKSVFAKMIYEFINAQVFK